MSEHSNKEIHKGRTLNQSSKKKVCSIIAERRERSERSEANNRVLFEIPRYLYIYIYIIYIYIYYICLSASALCKTVHTLRKSYHVGHCVFGTLVAVSLV